MSQHIETKGWVMNDQVLSDLTRLAAMLAGYTVMALLIVLVMRRRGPVWASSASNASLLALTLTFVVPAFFATPGGVARPFVATAPMALMAQCTVVAVTTALGSRLSRLPAGGDVRTAKIAPRRLFVARVPHQRAAALTSAGMAFAAMTAASLMATGGTSLVRGDDGGQGVSRGFPGWPTMLPAACAALVLAASAWWALREIHDRPRIADPLDTQLRARDASRVLRASTFGFAVTASAVLFSIGAHMNEATQLFRIESETAPRSPWDFYQWTAFALYVPAIALILVALGALAGSVGSRAELDEATRPAEDANGAHAPGRLDAGTRT